MRNLSGGGFSMEAPSTMTSDEQSNTFTIFRKHREFAVSEVDRYSANPTQALGYLLGYDKMRELRTKAENALGKRFDVKDFHAVAIDNGSMPLVVLEPVVDEWIARGGGPNKP
jgi:hypothetical protein